MNKIVCLLLALSLLYSCKPGSSDRPNVIIILTDDQGSVDVNVYGATDLATPNLDRLAEEGIRFSGFYVGSAICSPSRAAILTGLTPHSAGVPGNVSSIPGNAGMPSEITTLAEMLRQEGYTTGHVGKWHLGYTPETSPLAQGFDYSFGHMGGCIDNYSHFFYWNGPNRHDLWENGNELFLDGEYFPDLMAEKAENFIKKNKKKPFFLYYAINTPHYPLQPRPEWREYYGSMDMPRRDYAGFVSTADQNIGMLTALLDRLSLKNNTLLIFLSDHGHSYEERTFGGGGSAGPFRGGKTSLFEGGIRVPAIISWPDRIAGNRVNNELVHSIDIVPTVLAACSEKELPPYLEGVNILPSLSSNEKLPERTLYWKLGSQWAVRKGDWKLIGLPRDPSGTGKLDPEKDRLFLSNIAADSSEMTNLASEYPLLVDSLITEYLGWKNASADDIPEMLVEVQNNALGSEISMLTKPSPRYPGSGQGTLIDGRIGSRAHDDGFWMGWEGEDMIVLLDLKKEIRVASIVARFLNNPENWIFAPLEVSFSYSLDGKAYSRPVTLPGGNDLRKAGIRNISVPINGDIRYLKILARSIGTNPEWHSSPGGKAWLFCDEIIIK
ncbi:MAG: sulfatase-like hydrolase/transferase [Marinilabiliaceae bacterium]|jgi:arylsulfatase A-like enzyme|nr:sulfatase-like hydrolase/transferase [Marinilabiliaceae bacterium]